MGSEKSILLGGEMQKIPESVAWNDILIPESQWFVVDEIQCRNSLTFAFENGHEIKNKARGLMYNNREKFTHKKMTELLNEVVGKYTQNLPSQVQLKLPKLKKVGDNKNQKSKIELEKLLLDLTENKNGVEIGGPSPLNHHEELIIYKNATTIDNVIFSSDTVWSKHDSQEYRYYENKVGEVIINDGTDITDVESNSYDFLFASHTLEHIANPLKALKEWLRVTKDDGHLILILPEKSLCFDHKRDVSSFDTILSQYDKNVGEDDLSTLPEILEKHDLTMDLPAGNLEQFKKRSMDNYNNRCLHHYVYNEKLLKEMCSYLNSEFVYTITKGIDIWFIIQKKVPVIKVPKIKLPKLKKVNIEGALV